ncbi:UAA transporter family protein [Babesia bovis T2Bo]|uniref:UDP-galactose transporter, putative n=1 Tax=Babesia bovis TaxID=5865 RepID=A7ASK5_BABBO|nr:UAA transporter family protein [Babesia bovis T2Bo]EDO07524.1 UAA transporter family protein [Babesia bovis T2Bo]|eukprot:XP_001611092.1 UDP-galactose transporter [Babesia bovis T2Bo]
METRSSAVRRIAAEEKIARSLQPTGVAIHDGEDELYISSDSKTSSTSSVSVTNRKRTMKITLEENIEKKEVRRTMLKDAGLAAFLFSMVCVSFIVYQYLQEHLMRVPVLDGKKFDYPVFLTFTCFASNVLTTAVLMGGMQIKHNLDYKKRTDPNEPKKNVFDQLDCKIAMLGALAATSNVCAMVSSLASLKFIGVPTQIVIKSAKMIPILIGGFVIFGKRYPWYDYVAVLIITACIICFNFFKKNIRMEGENTPFGLFMCLFSLFWDGVTGPIEDKMLSLRDIHPFLLLFILNFFGFPIVAATVFIFEGLMPFKILANSPELWGYIMLLSLAASIGQIVIVICLKLYGSLYTTLMTTVRKIASSLISIFRFNHYMTPVQWVSMSGTFATVLIRQIIKYNSKSKHTAKQGHGH